MRDAEGAGPQGRPENAMLSSGTCRLQESEQTTSTVTGGSGVWQVTQGFTRGGIHTPVRQSADWLQPEPTGTDQSALT